MSLTIKERSFWVRALKKPPLEHDFDEMKVADMLGLLKDEMKELYGGSTMVPSKGNRESAVWSEMGSLVRQLQEARKIIRRLIIAQGASCRQSIRKENQEIASKFIPHHIDVCAPHRHESPMSPPESPILPPPSPIRTSKVQFCARDLAASLQTMKRHKDNARIQEQGCRAVVELLKDASKKRKADVVWSCESCKFQNSNSEGKCRLCTSVKPEQVMCETRPSDRAMEHLERESGLYVIIDAMRNFRSNKGLVRSASFALARITQEDPLSVERIANAGGILEILHAMQAWESDSEVQAQCLGILASPGLADDAVVRVEADQFAHIVCGVVKRFQRLNKKRLLALCFLALANLGVKLDAHVTLLIEKHQLHILVLDTLSEKSNQSHPQLVAACLWNLSVLTRELMDGSHAEICEKISRCGAVELAYACMSAFPTNQSVQKNASILLTRLGIRLEDGHKRGGAAADCTIS